MVTMDESGGVVDETSGVAPLGDCLAQSKSFVHENVKSVKDSSVGPIEAWYMDDSDADQRLPHKKEPNHPVSFEELEELGVLHWELDADIYETDPELQMIRDERGYDYQDIITVSKEKLANYEDKIKSFFEEHIHTDEEIRYVLDGSGYFDVRGLDEKWIRIHVKKGHMLVLPKGIYHRFTLDENNYIKAMRLFIGVPVWTPYNRPQEDNPARLEYIDAFLKKEHAAVQPNMMGGSMAVGA